MIHGVEGLLIDFLPSRLMTLSCDRLRHHRFGNSSLALDQRSITLLYFSPWVTRPDGVLFSISLTSVVARINDRDFLLRDDEVIDTDRNTGKR